MNPTAGTRHFLGITFLLLACGTSTEPDGRLTTVDAFLARVCTIAAGCPGIASTPQTIADCPLDIRSSLSQSQLTELGVVTTYTKTVQEEVLACMAEVLCGRFGGDITNISDSDVMEPFRGCRPSA